MASYYLWSGAVGSANGSSWANAYTTMFNMMSGKAAADVFYVAHDHVELTSVLTVSCPGTVVSPTKMICVDRAGSVPPVSADRRATAQVKTSGNGALGFSGWAHIDGIIFIAGNSTGNAPINLITAGSRRMRFDNCSLRIGSTGSGTIDTGGQSGGYIELNNTTLSFAGTGQRVVPNSMFRWYNTPSALLGTIPTTLFVPISGYGGSVECIGVDLSAAGSGKTLCGVATDHEGFTYRFIDCKLNAAVTRSAVPTAYGSDEIDFVRCGATAATYGVYRHRFSGLLTEETTIVRTGGALA